MTVEDGAVTSEALLDPTRAPETGAGIDTAILPDLSGRRIALVNNAWPSWHTMTDRLAELLAARFDGVTFAHYTVPNGSAAEPELLRRIAAEADAAVAGLANCGSCTAWAFHDSMELVRLGLPAVLVVTKEFGGLTEALVSAKKYDIPRVLLPLNPETVETGEALGLVDDIADRLTAAFLTRNGRAARRFAVLLLDHAEDARLPRLRDLAEELGVGNGTVQAALRLLEEARAVETTARGHLGTFLARADRGALWHAAARPVHAERGGRDRVEPRRVRGGTARRGPAARRRDHPRPGRP